MKPTKHLFSILFFSIFLISEISAQEQIVVERINEEFIFDGVVDEDFWQTIEPLQMIMYKPNFGKDPSEKSEVRIVYNDSYVMISAKLYDKDPSRIMATSKKRDEASTGNDRFTIIFDSFNDKENGLAFSTTPTGLRYDFTVSKDAVSLSPKERPLSSSWNTFWDAKTTRNEEGWFVEMRIPLSSLRFKNEDGKVVMGIICLRDIPHNNEVDVFPSIEPLYGFFSVYKPSKAQEVSFSNIESKKPFYIAPYVIGGVQQENKLNTAGDAYKLDSDPTKNIGLDIKYGLTNNLTLDLTYNTDFAQVEADDQQVNLTRFSLFFPEKRTFFQERSSIFSYDFESSSNTLFYSRTIGLSGGGEQVPIYGGARITGMVGKWDIGFIDMQTKEFNSSVDPSGNLNSENFGVLRARRNVINENSYLGGIFTSRLDGKGNYNFAYGADAIVKMFGNDYLNVKFAQTSGDSIDNKSFSLDNSQIYVDWNNTSTIGFGYKAAYTRSGKDFNPQVGFMTRSDYSYYNGEVSHGWLGSEDSKVYSFSLGMSSNQYRLNESNEIQSGESVLEARLQLKSGFMYTVMGTHQVENVTYDFDLQGSGVIVPAAEYGFNNVSLIASSSRTKPFVANATFKVGDMYDGNIVSIMTRPQWNLSPSVQLGMTYSYSRINFASRDEIFNAHLVKLTNLFMFSTQLSFNSYIQYSTASKSIITNMRLRYNPKEGNDLYLVYNDIRNTDIARFNPELSKLASRTIMLKYTYTFSL